MELFNRLITKIDVPEKQVQINAYMYEVKKGQNQRSSLDLFVDLLGSRLGLEFAGDTTQNRLKLNLPSITAVLSLLNKSDDFELLSSPFLLAKNNQNAKFVVGSEVPVLGQIVQNQNGQATQSVEYRQAGVIFDVTPRILNDTIELTINHQISSFINTTNGVNNSPTLIKRELTSVINAKHNDLVMLGGLQENTTTQVHSKLPFLPISFHGRSREDQDTEIMLLMSVQLI